MDMAMNVMIYNMKTISITVDEDILSRLDQLSDRVESGPNRSSMIREAMKAWVLQKEREWEEAREREIFRNNRSKLDKQAAALVEEQTAP